MQVIRPDSIQRNKDDIRFFRQPAGSDKRLSPEHQISGENIINITTFLVKVFIKSFPEDQFNRGPRVFRQFQGDFDYLRFPDGTG